MADLGDPSPAALAQALGVSVRSVARWRAAGAAPRAVVLALWPLTRWGRSALDAGLHNEAALFRSLAESRRAQVEALKRRLLTLEAAAPHGAANAPFFDPLRPLPTGAGRRPTVA